MSLTRRTFLRSAAGLFVAAAAAPVVEPVRRFWQVGAQLERPVFEPTSGTAAAMHMEHARHVALMQAESGANFQREVVRIALGFMERPEWKGLDSKQVFANMRAEALAYEHEHEHELDAIAASGIDPPRIIMPAATREELAAMYEPEPDAPFRFKVV